MTDPEGWLAERLARAPASLRERVQRALGDARERGGGAAFGRRLRDVGERLMHEAGQDDSRHAALTLLAADALVTLAVEWTAETDPAALATFE